MKVIITGASQGIGKGIATVLAREGFSLGLLARSGNRLEEVKTAVEAAGGTACIAACDLRQEAAARDGVHALIEQLGGLDALVNNAGLVVRKDILALSSAEWHAMVETNINGLYYATCAALPAMVQQGHGHLINLSSIAGKVPLPGGSAYAATKFAVTGLSQSLFQELRAYGIKVTTIYPGSIDTASHRHDPGEDHAWKVTPEEVGRACLDALRTRPGNCISEIEIRPLFRPPKSQ